MIFFYNNFWIFRIYPPKVSRVYIIPHFVYFVFFFTILTKNFLRSKRKKKKKFNHLNDRCKNAKKPCYWTRQRIHKVVKLRGNLILIHNFGHCLVNATGSIFLECIIYAITCQGYKWAQRAYFFSFIYNISVYTCKNGICVESIGSVWDDTTR